MDAHSGGLFVAAARDGDELHYQDLEQLSCSIQALFLQCDYSFLLVVKQLIQQLDSSVSYRTILTP